MSHSARSADYLRAGRQDRLLKELQHDPYHSKHKIKEPAACRDCGAVFHKGRWIWDTPAQDARQERCPACQRVHDKVPAGFLSLSGEFYTAHKDEILNLIANLEQKQRAQHPLKRIMHIEEQADKTVVTFTDAHLTHSAAEAVQHAYNGDLDARYSDEEILVRATWSR